MRYSSRLNKSRYTRSNGCPFLPRSRMIAKTVRASCISHTFLLLLSISHLPPFAMQTAFPFSDYYGGSVPLEVAPPRESRVYAHYTFYHDLDPRSSPSMHSF